MRKKSPFSLLILIGLIGLWGFNQPRLAAQTVVELQTKIQNHEADIKKLDAEINRYRLEISQSKQASTSLKKEIERLESAKDKLQADISITRNKISVAGLNIQRLGQGIETTTQKIENNLATIQETFRQINHQEQFSLPELLVGENTPSILWQKLEQYQSLNQKVADQINTLRLNKQTLEGDKKQTEVEKNQLTALEQQLADQRQITEATQKSKDSLLAVTKNQEANYQKLLADRLAKKQEVEGEMRKVEEALQYVLDPNKLPDSASGVLSWPLAQHKLTQSFGHTNFSKSAAGAVYNGKGHNGIDLAAAIGDKTFAAESGVVLGQGDTDPTCRGASYGRWILIAHDNGLATIYGHLSAIKVTEGQKVAKGELIGYTGNTGYTTGPHLHFSVVVKEAVKVGTLQSKVPGCGIYRLPLAPYSAYLNPLNYL